MQDRDVFWKLGAFSDQELIERLGSVLGSSRRLMAELLAHLGEVEVRRLHLVAACSSMFAYCVNLGMTEDEAYRRIEVARLARRYPVIFPLLANGQLTISAVALLKHHLSDENHLELLAAAAGKTVIQTRELIAARFPRPDVTSSVRKLPERQAMSQPSLAVSAPSQPRSGLTGSRPSATTPSSHETGPSAAVTEPSAAVTDPSYSQRATPPRVSSRIEPLSAQRYKVQFTASGELACKLELARDLMRHCHPGGELGLIVERAVDLLIESLMQRRFGKRKQARPKRTNERGAGVSSSRGHVMGGPPAARGGAEPCSKALASAQPCVATLEDFKVLVDGMTPDGTREERTRGAAEPDAAQPDTAELDTAELDTAELDTAELDTAELDTAVPNAAAPATPTTLDSSDVRDHGGRELTRASPYISRSTRRVVVERDGLGCSWLDESGERCGSRAWLEYDHRYPRAKGGGAEPDNVRLLCRHHNRFAAEREFGQSHVERIVAERRRERAARDITEGPAI